MGLSQMAGGEMLRQVEIQQDKVALLQNVEW